MNNKVIVLVTEDPSKPMFADTCKALGLPGINPINFIDPESHTLSAIYKDIFTDEMANQLMGYLVSKQETLLVWDIINSIHLDTERLVIVNATLLTQEDIRFLAETQEHVLIYDLERSPKWSATTIYDGSKSYRDEVGI